MTAKETASSVVNDLDDNATWGEVKSTIMKEYKRETGDAKADAIAAVIIASVFVCCCVFWISSQ